MRARPLILLAACLFVSLPVAPSAAAGPPCMEPAREPGSRFGFSAHLIARRPQGDDELITVELRVSPLEPIGRGRVEASPGRGSAPGVRELLGEIRPTAPGDAASLRRDLLVQGGVDHLIPFVLETEDSTGATLREVTYLRVNLDPSRQPDRSQGLNQYHGKPAGQTEP